MFCYEEREEKCENIPEKVPSDGLDKIPANEHKDVLVANVLESDGASKLVDEAHGVDDEAGKSETLATDGGLESLGGNDTLEGGVGEGEDDVEEEVSGQGALGVVAVDVEVGVILGVLLVHASVQVDLRALLGLLVKSGRETGVGGESNGAHEGTDDEHLAAGHAIGHGDGGQGTDGGDDRVEDVVGELLGGAGDTNVLEDDSVEVTETVAGELAEDGNHKHLGHAPAAVVGHEERAVIPPDLVDTVGLDTLPHLLSLEQDELGVGVAVAVVLDKEGNSLSLAVVGEEETGRLGEEEDGTHDDNTGESLEDQGNTPRPVALDKVAAVGNAGSGNGTSEPTAVVETSATPTPVRRGDFDRVSRSSDGHDRNTETKDEAANDELSELGRGSNDDSADDNNNTTAEHALLTAETIGEDSSEGSANHGTTGRSQVLERLKTKGSEYR